MNQGPLVKLYSKHPSKKLELLGEVSSHDFTQIKNQIIGNSVGGTKSLVTELLEKGGWDKQRDQKTIFTRVCELFIQSPNINVQTLKQYTKSKQTRDFLGCYLKSHIVFNIHDMLIKEHGNLLQSDDFKHLINELWDTTTSINNVSVGPGEICLTTLTNARKGRKGDLVVTNVGEVEIKSSRARIGSDINTLKFPEKVSLLTKGKISKSSSWCDAVQSFFFKKWNIIENQYLDAFTWLSPQKLSDNELKSLKHGVKSILQKHDLKKILQIDNNRRILGNVILAIQMCCYQATHKFTYLLSVNKETKDAYGFYFNGKNLEQNVISIYDQIVKIGRFYVELSIDSTRKGVCFSLK